MNTALWLYVNCEVRPFVNLTQCLVQSIRKNGHLDGSEDVFFILCVVVLKT